MSLNMLVYRVTEKQDVASPGETGDPFEAFNVSAAKRIATRRQQVKGTVLVLENMDGRRPRLVATKDAHGIWTDTAQTLLWSLLVVFTAPRFDQGLGVGQGRKPVFVQAFVAEALVEGLDVGVLVRLAGFNETQGQPLRVRPCEHRATAELLPVVRAEDLRKSAGDRQAV